MDKKFINKIYSEKEYYNIVRNTVKSKLYSKQECDITDCIDEVYCRAMQADGLEKHENIKGWLFITARNTASNFNREYVHQNEKWNEYSDETLADTVKYDDLVIEHLEYLRVNDKNIEQKVLKKFTKSERLYYDLRYKQHLTYEQISEKLSLGEGTPRTLDSRIKNKALTIIKLSMK